ncbi:MAG: hypothetical protein JWM95_720, partial [Gemmatimonadetes bacterium]|nr:hypothetical protein [Gemmatimonadota bacterium]
IVLESTARWPNAARKLDQIGVPDLQTFRAKKRLKTAINELVFSVRVELEGEFAFDHEVEDTDCKDTAVTATADRYYQVTARDLQPKGDLTIRVTRTAKAPVKLKGE